MNAKKKLYGYNRFDRMLRMIACAAAMTVIFALGGCNQTGGESSNQSSGGEEQSSESSGINIDLSSRPEEGDWYRNSCQIIQVNGKFDSDAQYVYSGGDIQLKTRVAYVSSSTEPVSTKMVVLLDGYLHPFRFEDETEEKMVHTFMLEQDEETFLEATLNPLSITSDCNTEITVAFFFGYDRYYNESSILTQFPASFLEFSIQIKAEDTSFVHNHNFDIMTGIPSEVIELEEDSSLCSFEFLNNEEWGFKFYKEIKRNDSQVCRIGVSGTPGQHKLFLFMNDKPVQAFDEKYQLMWFSDNVKSGYYFDLNMDFLEGLPLGSKHNICMVLITEDDNGRLLYRPSNYVTIKIVD